AQTAIEAKGKERISTNDLKGLRQFKAEYPEVKNLVIVCLEKKVRQNEEGIWILPYQDFLTRLWSGEWTQVL
ncbi:MAG: AAA family ATPase, partial [Deltaproteobacteria bacterium]|nr:AAA family ATPase [Deltaproteobacteria bacterium]